MKWITIVSYLSIYFFGLSCDMMQTVRTQYHAIESKKQLDDFLRYTKSVNCTGLEPYVISAEMRQAVYAFLPTTKLKYFNTGKKKLEKYIKDQPKNIEARYIRMLVQHETPAILGYKSNLETDYNFVKENIKQSDLPKDYQELILKNINLIKKDL